MAIVFTTQKVIAFILIIGLVMGRNFVKINLEVSLKQTFPMEINMIGMNVTESKMPLMKNKESKSCLRLISLRKLWMNFETLNIEKPHFLRKIRI